MHKLTLSFNHVIVQNVGGYYGEHRLDFPSGQRNMLMVSGDNTAGKTSLINGLKWCLFNQIAGSRDRLLDPYTLYNRKALRSGADHPMSVTIAGHYNGRPIIIERRADWLYPKTPPANMSEMEIAFTVTQYDENGVKNVLDQDKSERFISRIAPPILARFFLFDGELLDEYRDLVSASQMENRALAKAIEGVLGLPVISKAQSIVKSATNRGRKVSTRLAKGQRAEQTAALIDAMQEDNRRFESEADEMDDTLDQVQKSYHKASNELEKHLEDERIQHQLSVQKNNLDTVTARIQQHRETLSQYGGFAWHDLALQGLAQYRDTVTQRTDRLARASQNATQKDYLESLRREVLANDQCPVCDQAPDTHARERLARLIDELDADRNQQASHEAELEGLISTRNRIQGLLSHLTPVKDRYMSLLETIDDEQDQKSSAESAIEALYHHHTHKSPEEIAKLRNACHAYSKEIGVLENKIKTLKQTMAGNEQQIQKLDDKLQQESEQNEKSKQARKVVKRLEKIEAVIEKARERQAEAMRQKVEEYTSHAYAAMTHEAHHERVEIAKDTFCMTIIDDAGDPVSVPSAGATQILALSLIISLGQIGRKIGPLIMDTPLGRLDSTHRLKVLEYLPKHSHQVAMFYHNGEIDGAMYDRIADKVGKSYLIRKDDRENSSRFEAL
ncbi:AAA family ATPase [Vreelandella massiliensis]|uniref:AAA family ATPase n=1 Tax=Vreelandella massiliensis TaxID=1816686 RepID=UPI00096A9FE5|nr:AAA family ATPase [Halomonas massiliensis]